MNTKTATPYNPYPNPEQRTMNFGHKTERDYPHTPIDEITREALIQNHKENMDTAPGTKLEALSNRVRCIEEQVTQATGDLYRKTNALLGPPEQKPVGERPHLDDDSPSVYALETAMELLEISTNDLSAEVSRYTESGL